MANSNNKQSGGLISQAFGVAKKLSTTGLDLVNHVAPGSVAKLKGESDPSKVVESSSDTLASLGAKKDQTAYENPQQMIRSHVPKLTQQLLGRHYNKVNNVASLVSPDLNNKIADYFFEKLNDFVSEQSSVDHLLKEVGAKELTDLAQDPSRSARISQALTNQNKTVAAVQGAITGASGVVGTAIDIPLSLALTLRSIYQSGRAHGFELDHRHEQNIVEYVFKQVDLGSIAEKQTLLVGLRALSNLLQTQDTTQIQRLLGSSNDVSVLKNWLTNADGSLKWTWLNHFPQISVLSKLTPLAGAGIGAVYSWKLAEDVSTKAEQIFSHAQQYLIQHPNESLDVLSAYEKSQTLLQQATPLLTAEPKTESKPSVTATPVVAPVENKVITQVEVVKKGEEASTKPEPVSTESGLQKLVEQHVEPVDEVTTQKSLAHVGEDELIQPLDEDDLEYEADAEQSKGEAKVAEPATSDAKVKKKASAKPPKAN
ncbi:EcsC family protein [Acinetobacter sp. 187]|uniref:EcsC family protein n=1 Tax=Acinetobacter lanii TaxID=2715163 RepID=UPI0014078BD1|nr:EcsC family protein [Acinetobacter lanii]NHC04721.1 EcsC family protein [Acinetobacter lanii]